MQQYINQDNGFLMLLLQVSTNNRFNNFQYEWLQ